MAVQIPTLKRIGPQAPESVGRANVQAADFSKANAIDEASARGVLSGVQQFAMLKEEEAIETASSRAQVEFMSKAGKDLEELESWRGDPTAKYAEKREAWKQSIDDLLKDQYGNMSGFAQDKVRKSLEKSYNDLTVRSTMKEANQYRVYQRETELGFKQYTGENIAAFSELIQDPPMDPKTGKYTKEFDLGQFEDIGKQVDLVRQKMLKRMDADGMYTIAPDGKKLYNESAKIEMMEAVSSLIAPTIKALDSSGKPEAAKALLSQYNNQMTSEAKKGVLGVTKTNQIKRQGVTIADSLRTMDPADAYDKIDRMDVPVEVKEVARDAVDSRRRRTENALATSEKRAMDMLTGYVMERQRSDKPFLTSAELRNDATYQQIADKIGAKNAEKLFSIIDSRDESSPKAKASVYKIFEDRTAYDMSYEELQLSMAGLGKDDKKKFEKQWELARQDTTGEQAARMSRMSQDLEKQMQATDVIKKNQYGRYNNDMEKDITKAKDAMMENMRNMRFKTVADEKEWIKEHVGDFVAGKVFTSPAAGAKFEASSKPGATKKTTTKTVPEQDNVPVRDKTLLWFKMKGANAPAPANLKELNEFYQANKGKAQQ